MVLKVVNGTEPPKKESPIADQIRLAAERAIADGAMTFMAYWEWEDEKTGLGSVVIPNLECVADGMHRMAWKIHQNLIEDED